MSVVDISKAKGWKGTKLTTWIVTVPDVWGNAQDGWEVNDASQTGTTTLLSYEDDDTVIRDLIEDEQLTDDVWGNIVIDGDESILYITREDDGYPLLQLQRIPD